MEERKSLKLQMANCREENLKTIENKLKEVEDLIENETADGFINTNNMWSFKKRVFPKHAKIAPSAKKEPKWTIRNKPG